MTAHDPGIVSRAAWGANPLNTPAGQIAVPSAELWLHHTAGEQFGAAGMRMLQQFTTHRTDSHYVDLEYTFVLDHTSNQVFESRGVGRNTAATLGHNDVSHAICVMGNFQNDPVSDSLVDTIANLVAWGFERGWWPLGLTGGHRDSGFSTACPGDHLEARIGDINARARAIHVGTPPPPVWKVHPMYAPPLSVAAVLKNDAGNVVGGVSPDGHVFAWGIKFDHDHPEKSQPFGNAYWQGRQAATIEWPNSKEKAAGMQHTVVATSGERYSFK